MKVNLLNEFKVLLQSSQLINNNLEYQKIIQDNLNVNEI